MILNSNLFVIVIASLCKVITITINDTSIITTTTITTTVTTIITTITITNITTSTTYQYVPTTIVDIITSINWTTAGNTAEAYFNVINCAVYLFQQYNGF